MQSLGRFISISVTLARYRLDELILSTPALKHLRPLIYLTPWFYLTKRSLSRGERLRLALEDLGPIFIKFGQTLSTRPDLLPDDISAELVKLQDACPAFAVSDAKRIIEHDLDGSINQLFSRFDDTPLASASIAQAHTACTLEGEEVVVKVLRPNIRQIINRDLALMYGLARLINRHSISKKLRPIEIVDEFKDIILAELDLLKERDNAVRIGQNFANSKLLYIPKVHAQLCSENVLTTERIYGTPVANIEQLKAKGVDLKQLAENGVIIFFTQVFRHNFFHADMHPGNIFVADNGQYLGVDFGIMGSLSESDKDFIADIFLSFFRQDYHAVARAYVDSGWASASTDIKAFEAAIGRICEPMFAKPLGEISFGQVLMEIIQEAKNFDIQVQPQLLLLDKTLLNIEGLGRQLYPQLDLWATAKPFLEELLKERYSVKNTFEKLSEEAPHILKEVPELPRLTINALKKINQLEDLSSLQTRQTESIVEQLRSNAKQQTSAVFAGSFAILSGVLFTQDAHPALSVLSAILALIFWFRSR